MTSPAGAPAAAPVVYTRLGTQMGTQRMPTAFVVFYRNLNLGHPNSHTRSDR